MQSPDPALQTLSRRRRSRAPWLLGAAALAVVLADQLTKHWALDALQDGVIDVVWTLRFNLAFNTGASFSIGDRIGPLVAVVALVVSVLLVRVGLRLPGRLGPVAAGCVLGGVIGNLLDRLFRSGDGFLHGAVVDFIDFQWWPVFNVADMGIVLGGMALLAAGLLSSDADTAADAASAAEADAAADADADAAAGDRDAVGSPPAPTTDP